MSATLSFSGSAFVLYPEAREKPTVASTDRLSAPSAAAKRSAAASLSTGSSN